MFTTPCVNLRTLGPRVTGVQRYVLGLFPHLQDRLVPVRPAAGLHGIGGHLWEQFILPARTRGRLLWSPGNTGPLAVARQVVTVHDASTLDHPEWFEGKFARWYRYLLPRLMKKARRVITVSEDARRRLVEAVALPADRVVAIHNGVEERMRPAEAATLEEFRRRQGLTKPYVLCVASLEPRKNLRTLFAAWERWQPPETELVVAGAAGGIFKDRGFVEPAGPVRLLGAVAEEDLPCLYSGAEAFVFPSVYEGFGLPPLEAMACGCPVLTSHATSLPEVCGPGFQPERPDDPGAVLYFDPGDPESLVAGLQRLLGLDPGQRRRLVANGLAHARRFSWQEAARRTWQVLAEAAEG